MPTYTYQCYECGHRFEHTCPADKRQDYHPCKSCSEMAEQLVPEGLGHAFDVEASSNGLPVPQNTGVASYDYDFDRVVASQARERMLIHKQREAYKRDILRDNPGAGKEDLARDLDGNYIVVPRGNRQQAAVRRAYAEAVKQKAQAFLGEGGEVREHDAHLFQKRRR